MILRFSVFSSPWLVLSFSPTVALLSLHLYLSCHLPLRSTHYHLLPFIIFHYIYSQVCLQKCPCSHPLSLFPVSLSNPLLSFPPVFCWFLHTEIGSISSGSVLLPRPPLSSPPWQLSFSFSFRCSRPPISPTPLLFLTPSQPQLSRLHIRLPLPLWHFFLSPQYISIMF